MCCHPWSQPPVPVERAARLATPAALCRRVAARPLSSPVVRPPLISCSLVSFFSAASAACGAHFVGADRRVRPSLSLPRLPPVERAARLSTPASPWSAQSCVPHRQPCAGGWRLILPHPPLRAALMGHSCDESLSRTHRNGKSPQNGPLTMWPLQATYSRPAHTDDLGAAGLQGQAHKSTRCLAPLARGWSGLGLLPTTNSRLCRMSPRRRCVQLLPRVWPLAWTRGLRAAIDPDRDCNRRS
jgi:hypothetical protein